MKKMMFLSVGILVGLGLTGCGLLKNDKAIDNKETKPKIMATFYPMYEFTKAVVGEEADVELVIEAGVEAHDYEPSARDMGRLAQADAVVYNSSSMETWIDKVRENTGKEVTYVEAAQDIELMTGHSHSHEEADHEGHDHEGHDHGEEAHEETDTEEALDPHVWLNPQMAQTEVKTIVTELSQLFPDKAANFQKNGNDYIEKLKALDKKFESAFANKKQRTFVTQHEAFGYLAKRYDLEQTGITGLSTEEEPSPKRLAELKDIVQEKQLKTIYFEGNATSKVAETLAKETGVSTSVLNTLESLSDQEQKDGATYLTVMTENLNNLQKVIK